MFPDDAYDSERPGPGQGPGPLPLALPLPLPTGLVLKNGSKMRARFCLAILPPLSLTSTHTRRRVCRPAKARASYAASISNTRAMYFSSVPKFEKL